MEKILVSACLLGVSCRYDGKSKPNERVLKLLEKDDIILIPVCPEILGGLPTPREGNELQNKASDIIKNKGKVKTKSGKDTTENFIKGAFETLRIAKLYNIKKAILKEKSPSCGVNFVYDGSFSKNLIKGEGVTAYLLKKNNIKAISENEIDKLF